MAAKQQIYRERRDYNQWVNNQTLEDYSLRFTAKAARKWSLLRVANTALGSISFLALEAIGAAITISYGFDNAVTAILIVGLLIFCAGLPICYYAAKYGVDIDLLTRGAGFGYLGSTATSLIYASFTFIFFALEAAIMAKALELMLGIPMVWGYVISSLVAIPLVFYGITFISRFQLWTQPLWLVLQLIPFVFILISDSSLVREWANHNGTQQTDDGIDLLLFGSAASVMFALVAQIGEQVDFLRFLPPKTPQNSKRWWCALLCGGPGWIVVGCIKLIIGSFLAVVALHYGSTLAEASDPTSMYAVAFHTVTQNSHFALILAGIFVVISQLKINVTNAYAGSIAWSNFFSRLTHSHPGRVVWLVFNVSIALLLMELGIYHAFESTLSIYAIVAVSWVSALVADLVINKPLGFSPKHIEFKRAYLYDINPVGVGAMVLASITGISAYLGLMGQTAHALAHFITVASALVLAPLIAWLTKGKYYCARPPVAFSDAPLEATCVVCENTYEPEDIAHCPAYEGYICSLCCSLDARCQDLCKPHPRISETIIDCLQRFLPNIASHYLNARFLHFALLLSTVATVTGALLALVYSNIQTDNIATNELLQSTLWKVFFIITIIAGVICWLFVLAHQSQKAAQAESRTQTQKLIQEIHAHEKTDLKLQQAKEQAEAANNAKSRYLTGISHELRSPLNTVLGYAQLMEMDESMPEKQLSKVAVIKRSGEHLADLIEGLLDISKIEAGRLEIQRNAIQFKELLDQLEQMFSVQASEAGLDFRCERLTPIPTAVMGDEKRIRQILINLLTNAIKYTEHGNVTFSIKYRNQVAEFNIIDTGIGISQDEYERIFKPFERVRNPGSPTVAGTGLGLTITRLLTDIMGGDISVRSNPGGGSIFTVWLMLSPISAPKIDYVQPRKVYGYNGSKKSIMVVDDDATHRGLIADLLSPLGFSIVEAPDAESCLTMISEFTPDLFLIDRRMPGMNGPELANTLRQIGFKEPILMVTANANEDILSNEQLIKQQTRERLDIAYNDYLIKPIKLDVLLGILDKYLNIDWIMEQRPTTAPNPLRVSTIHLPDKSIMQQLKDRAEVGHLSRVKQIIDELSSDSNIDPVFMAKLKKYSSEVKFSKIITLLQESYQ